MSLKDEFYKKIVKNEDSEEFINWVMDSRSRKRARYTLKAI